MTQTPYEIGRANASEAIDQAPGLIAAEPDYYRTFDDVLASYAENVGDTLAETGQVNDAAFLEAIRGFNDVLSANGIDYRLA